MESGGYFNRIGARVAEVSSEAPFLAPVRRMVYEPAAEQPASPPVAPPAPAIFQGKPEPAPELSPERATMSVPATAPHPDPQPAEIAPAAAILPPPPLVADVDPPQVTPTQPAVSEIVQYAPSMPSQPPPEPEHQQINAPDDPAPLVLPPTDSELLAPEPVMARPEPTAPPLDESPTATFERYVERVIQTDPAPATPIEPQSAPEMSPPPARPAAPRLEIGDVRVEVIQSQPAPRPAPPRIRRATGGATRKHRRFGLGQL